MNVLYFNLSVDANDTPLAFGIDWIENFSRTFESVDVITFRKGDFNLPGNVMVHDVSIASRFTFISKVLTVCAFYSVLCRLIRTKKYDLCFSHMNIMFVNLGWIVCRLYDIPMKLWYAHPAKSLKLRCALLMVDEIVTSFPGAFPFSSTKVREIGTGITLDLFEEAHSVSPSYDILYCGRVSRSKNIEDLVSAVYDIKSAHDRALKVLIVGPTANTKADETYTEELKRKIKFFKLEDEFTFYGAAKREELVLRYGSAKVHVNLTHAGFGDKVVLESMYCMTPTLMRNVGMQSLVGDHRNLFLFDTRKDLVNKLMTVLELDDDLKRNTMREIREHIQHNHNIDTIARRVLNA